MLDTTSLFFVGLAVGFICAVVGAFIDAMLARRRPAEESRLPGCILLVTGALGFTGVVVTVASLLLDGGLKRPFIVGSGVVAGFLGGFVILLGIWWLLSRR